MKHEGVHHVSINVRDTASAGKFYVELLGMEELPRPDFGFPGMWLRCGGQELHLLEVENHEAPEGQHFALRVENIEAAREELIGRGVKVTPVSEIPGVGRQCFLRDPSGNLVELNQPNPLPYG